MLLSLYHFIEGQKTALHLGTCVLVVNNKPSGLRNPILVDSVCTIYNARTNTHTYRVIFSLSESCLAFNLSHVWYISILTEGILTIRIVHMYRFLMQIYLEQSKL